MKPIYRFRIDANEIIDNNVYLFSRCDERLDVNGRLVRLEEGMIVEVYEEDVDEESNSDDLIGTGVVIPTPTELVWASARDVRWSIQLAPPGLRHRSKLTKAG